MKQELEALIEHLKDLKSQGVTDIYIQDSTLDNLKRKIQTLNEENLVEESIVSSKSAYSDKIPNVLLPNHPDKKFLLNVLKAQALANPLITSNLKTNCQLVFGDGNLNSPIVIVGEAPGEEEEKAGKPFIGRAGKLLRQLLQDVSLDSSNTYICNIMLWRPITEQNTTTNKGNRPPTLEEMDFCLPFFKSQLEIVKPSCIIALGATAISGLLGVDKNRKITQVRGTWGTYNNIPVMQTFHPSYLLRVGTDQIKNSFIQDLLEVKKEVKLPILPNEKFLYT